MAEVTTVLSFDDKPALDALDRVINKGEALDETIKDVQGSGDAAMRGLANSVGTAEKAVSDAVKTAQQYREQMRANQRAIEENSTALNRQRADLAKLRTEYIKAAQAGSQGADQLKQKITALETAIKETETATEALRLENVALRDELQAASGDMQITANQAQNLRFQFTDLFTQIGSGQGVIRPLIQQGPQIVEALGGAGNAARFFGGQIRNAAKFAFSTRGAIALLGGGLVGLIAIPLISFFSKSSQAAAFFADKIAFVGGIVKELSNRIFGLGEAIFGLITGTKEWSDVTAAATKIISGGYADAGREAQAFAQTQKEIARQQEAFIVQEARLQSLSEQRRRIAEDESRTTRERIAALKEASSADAQAEAQRLRFARARFDALAREGDLGDGQTTNLEEQRKLQADIIKLQAQAAAREFQDDQQLRAIRQKAIDDYRQQREELERLAQEAQKVRDRLAELQRGELSGVAAIRAQGDAALLEIRRQEEALRAQFAAKRQRFDLENEFAEIRAIAERQTQQKISDFIAAEQARLTGLTRANAIDRAALVGQELEAIQQQGQAVADLQDTEIKRLAATRANLAQQLAFAQQAFLNGLLDGKVVTGIRRQLDAVVAQYDAALASARIGAFDRFKDKLLKSLGISQEEAAAIGQSVASALNSAFDIFTIVQQERIAQVDQQITLIDQRISELQKTVDEERKRQSEGLANDLSEFEDKLAKEQALRREALEERAKLEARAARQRLAQDSAQQASDIITATTQLARQGASTGVIGLIAAIGGLALIARIIAQGRAIARQQERQGFKDGTEYVTGPGTTRSDSVPANLSVGERVVPAHINKGIGAISNDQLGRIVQQWKALPVGFDFAAIAAIAAGANEARREASEQAKREELQAIREAHQTAADRAADKMIGYWQTRPVEKWTEAGRVVEFVDESGAKVRQVFES